MLTTKDTWCNGSSFTVESSILTRRGDAVPGYGDLHSIRAFGTNFRRLFDN